MRKETGWRAGRKISKGLGLLVLQPEDGNEVFYRFELRITGEDLTIDTFCGGNTEGIGIGDRILGLDLRSLFDEIVIHRKELHGKLLKQSQGLFGLLPSNPSSHNVVELTPVDPPEQGLFFGAGKLMKDGFDLVRARLPVK